MDLYDMMDFENVRRVVVNKITNKINIVDEGGDEVMVSQDLIREINSHAEDMDDEIVEVVNNE